MRFRCVSLCVKVRIFVGCGKNMLTFAVNIFELVLGVGGVFFFGGGRLDVGVVWGDGLGVENHTVLLGKRYGQMG